MMANLENPIQPNMQGGSVQSLDNTSGVLTPSTNQAMALRPKIQTRKTKDVILLPGQVLTGKQEHCEWAGIMERVWDMELTT